MTVQQSGWFFEDFEESQSAFGLKVKRKLAEQQTPYQRVEIYETTDWGNLMVNDGCVMLSTRDNFFYHEMMVHPAMFIHDNPENVVIIGGGDCGTLREVLKHDSVKTAVQVDIDEVVTRFSEKYFPELCESNNDERATLLFDDGVAWMKNAPSESADIIIVDSTDPIGPAEGLFNQPFFDDCFRVLRKGGILLQQSGSPLLDVKFEIAPMLTKLEKSGCEDLAVMQFPQPVYPTGWWSASLGRKGATLGNFREAEANTMAATTEFYSAAAHHGAFCISEKIKARAKK